MDTFKLKSDYSPTGDQPAAIAQLTDGILSGRKKQVLLGVTGSGKTFTMANVIANVNRPTLVLAHNKTLAAQLCSELREFFPENAVEYFVSYYDYYQPEAYLPAQDVYIEKDSAINDDIDRLRHSATLSLAERRDVIIVASVSCIYSIGSPEDYRANTISLRPGMELSRDDLVGKLVDCQYQRNDISFERNKFRVRGDTVEIFPAGGSVSRGGDSDGATAVRVEFWGDEIENVSEFDVITGNTVRSLMHVPIFPATHYIVDKSRIEAAVAEISKELEERVEFFTREKKFIEAQRIVQRTRYDIEMLKELGTCKGVENYSRILSGRPPGSTPYTLIDHFPEDFLMMVDESHVTLPQVRGMFGGDFARHRNLVEYGFRLPSSFDNRPMNFDEFTAKMNQVVFVSATPAPYEREQLVLENERLGTPTSGIVSDGMLTCSRLPAGMAEQIIRPTGLLDPVIILRPVEGQMEDLLSEINTRADRGERVLVTTLTKKMAEALTAFLDRHGARVRYMHHDVETVERMKILRDLRLGEFDVLVGINLLREGLDIPEVSLVAILDADKEGFLRSETSLVQTIGRAARNADGTVIMYADVVTRSMEAAMTETARRREIQQAYNEAHGITPKSIVKDVRDVIDIAGRGKGAKQEKQLEMSAAERKAKIAQYTVLMKDAAKLMDFEQAAVFRDLIARLNSD